MEPYDLLLESFDAVIEAIRREPHERVLRERSADEALFVEDYDFDSHDFLRALADLNPRLYIEALNKYLESVDPFRSLHAQLARHLSNTDLVVSAGQHLSLNVYGRRTECETWRFSR